MIPTTPYPIFLAQGIVQYIAQISPPIVPVASLTAPSAVGDQLIKIPNGTLAAQQMVQAFTPDTVLSFLDGTAERKAVVASVDATADPAKIALSFEGRATPGLTVAHGSGAQVAVNLFRTYLGDRANTAFNSGFPVIAVWVMNNAKNWQANAQWTNQAIASVLYRLSGEQPDGPKLHPQIWLEETLDRAENDIQKLVAGLQVNSTIKIAGTSYAFLVNQFITARRDSLADAAHPVFEFLVDIHVQGLFETTH